MNDRVHNTNPDAQNEQGWYHDHCILNTNHDSGPQNQLHYFHATIVGRKTFWGPKRWANHEYREYYDYVH